MRQQVENVENQHLIWALKKLQQKTFEGVNKPRKYLAYQPKKKKRKEVDKITEDQKEVMEEDEIKDIF